MPKAPDPNLTWLEEFASRAASLLPDVTLVGGCAAGLLITDPGAASVRPTIDIDVVIEAATYAEYGAFCAKLTALSFVPCMDEDAPICRWALGSLRVDVLSISDRALGFGNRWYASAVRSRVTSRLPSGAKIHHLDAPHFVATKLEAFRGRGDGDYVMSHDLEDVVRVIDGRAEIVDEFASAPADLHGFVAEDLRRCLADRLFVEALPAYFPGASEGAVRSRHVQGAIRAILESSGRRST